LTVSIRTVQAYKSEDRNITAEHRQNYAVRELKGEKMKSNLIERIGQLILMLMPYRWIIGLSLLFALLGGTFVSAEPLKIQQRISKSNRDNMTLLTIGSQGLRPFYFGRKRHGLTDFVPGQTENSLFDIFCGVDDNEWLRPGQISTTPTPQRLPRLGSELPTPTRSRHQLRPC
jgi:hypothetical protein